MTKDGSRTVLVPSLDVTYRSRHGAMQESVHVFIEAGLKYILAAEYKPEARTETTTVSTGTNDIVRSAAPIIIFELGFGTGLNALLSCLECLQVKQAVHYITIEPEPLDSDMIKSLEYNDEHGFLTKMHECDWNASVEIHAWFMFTKYRSTLADLDRPITADLVYFDAFGPLTQPELWTTGSFQKILSMMKPGAVLTTYSSKSEVRRNMTAAGLKVTKIPGPRGKREMVRAFRPEV